MLCSVEDIYVDTLSNIWIMATFIFLLKYELSLCFHFCSPTWWATSIFTLLLLLEYRLDRCLTMSRPTNWQEAYCRDPVQSINSVFGITQAVLYLCISTEAFVSPSYSEFQGWGTISVHCRYLLFCSFACELCPLSLLQWDQGFLLGSYVFPLKSCKGPWLLGSVFSWFCVSINILVSWFGGQFLSVKTFKLFGSARSIFLWHSLWSLVWSQPLHTWT